MPTFTLKAARVNTGFSQKEAAKLIGVSNKTLSSWEKGKTVPNAKHVERLCSLYGRSYEEIIFLP